MLNKKNILVTGAAGFIGSHLVDRLLREDTGTIVVIDNLFLGDRCNLDEASKDKRVVAYLGTEYTCCDYEIMEGVILKHEIDIVFDLATIPLPVSLARPRWCFDEITSMGSVICELLRKKMFSKLFHVSTSEVYGTAESVPMTEQHPWNARTSYAASKGAVDLMIKSYVATFGVDAVILRPFNNYGPRQNDGNYAGVIPIFINNRMKDQTSNIFGDGENSRDFIYALDTADIIIEISKVQVPSGEVINIASGTELTINNIFKAIYADGKDQPVYQDERIGDVRRHFASTEKLFSYIAEYNFTPFSEGIVETSKWYEQK